jgi:quinolinate synthase
MPDRAVESVFERRYTLPAIETVDDTAEEIQGKQRRVRELCTERNAVLLAHHYRRPEVQEAAHEVADSLMLTQAAAKTNADVIAFCGVHFMAETAAILLPDKTVLLPDLAAGCSLAASVTAEEVRRWKAMAPNAVVVAYINTSAAVKAESDYCCTSANAAKVVSAIPAERPILFCRISFSLPWSRGRLGEATSSRVRAIATCTRPSGRSRWLGSSKSIMRSNYFCIPNVAA